MVFLFLCFRARSLPGQTPFIQKKRKEKFPRKKIVFLVCYIFLCYVYFFLCACVLGAVIFVCVVECIVTVGATNLKGAYIVKYVLCVLEGERCLYVYASWV